MLWWMTVVLLVVVLVVVVPAAGAASSSGMRSPLPSSSGLVLGVALVRLLLRGDRLVCLAAAGAQGQRQQECQQQRRVSMSSLFHIGSSFLFFPMGRDRNIPPYKLSVRWDVLER